MMFTHAINKQAFEFTCTSEHIAKTVQEEIEHYTAEQLNNIISQILARESGMNTDLKIDKIEIDLGDVRLQDFGNADMLIKFKDLFTDRMTSIHKEKERNEKGRDIIDEKESKRGVTGVENELEVIEAFLLHGDVPWWVNKMHAADPEAILLELIERNPGAIKSLLQRQKERPDILLRVIAQHKPSTRSILNELVPGFLPPSFSQLILPGTFQNVIQQFSFYHLEELKAILDDPDHYSFDALLYSLSDLIIESDDVLSLNNNPLVNVLASRELTAIQLLLENRKKEKTLRKKVRDVLKDLSERTVLFLLYQVLSSRRSARLNIKDQGADHEKAPGYLLSAARLFPENVPGPTNEPGSPHQNHRGQGTGNSYQRAGLQEAGLGLISPPRGASDDTGEKPGVEDDLLLDNETTKKNGNRPPAIARVEQHAGAPDDATNEPDRAMNEGSTGEDPYKKARPGNNGLPEASHGTDEFEPGHSPVDNAGLATRRLSTENKQPGIGGKKGESNLSGNERKNDRTTDATPGTEEGKPRSESAELKKVKQLAFFLKGLNIGAPLLSGYLNKLTKNDVEHLHDILKKHRARKTALSRMINTVVEHPYLLKYNLFEVFAGLSSGDKPGQSPGNTGIRQGKKKRLLIAAITRKMQSAVPHFIASFDQLSLKHAIVLRDILQKGMFETPSEKNIMKGILRKLPGESIRLLHFLTQLPEEEIQKLKAPGSTALGVKKGGRNAEPSRYDTTDGTEKVYVGNAGLCLIALYLPGLFTRMGYIENSTFRNKAIANRAVYVLQHIVTGKRKSPEFLLQLNKLLCGFELEDSITGSIRLTRKETLECESLLESVISNWKALKSTSVKAFRESFLQRKGIIFENGSSWTLQVERKPYDLLLNSIPWGYTMIKFPWMRKMIEVEW